MKTPPREVVVPRCIRAHAVGDGSCRAIPRLAALRLALYSHHAGRRGPAGVGRGRRLPVLVRLHKDFFDFSQAKAGRRRLRFSTSAGEPLAYQIEEWDAASGHGEHLGADSDDQGQRAAGDQACTGARPTRPASPDGKAVFNESNGYLSVWHMNDRGAGRSGHAGSKDTGTTATPGSSARRGISPAGRACSAATRSPTYPDGRQPAQHRSLVPGREAERHDLAWGNEQGQGKVVMQFRSPPHVAHGLLLLRRERGRRAARCRWPSGCTSCTPTRTARRGST